MSKSKQTVLITANHQSTRNTFHTSKDCKRLPENYYERERDRLPDQWTECSYCEGDVDISGGPKTNCPYCGETVKLQNHLPDNCEEL